MPALRRSAHQSVRRGAQSRDSTASEAALGGVSAGAAVSCWLGIAARADLPRSPTLGPMDARTYPAKATPKSQRTRARILDAAMRLFAEIGYHAASNAVIADAAQLTRGAMLYHFATREELVEAAIAHIELHRARLFEQAAATPAAAGVDAAEHAIDVYWSLLHELPFLAFAELEAAARTDAMLSRAAGGAPAAPSTTPSWAATGSGPWSRPATTRASRPAATSAASCWRAWPRAR